MAELTNLETKLGEVIGLAMAAQAATERVEKLTTTASCVAQLKTMRKEAAQAEKDGTAVAALDRRQEGQDPRRGPDRSRQKGATMMKTYLERGSDELDGFEFLTMAEAARSATGRCCRS